MLYFKFGSKAGASAFLGLYISDLDNSAADLPEGYQSSEKYFFFLKYLYFLSLYNMITPGWRIGDRGLFCI